MRTVAPIYKRTRSGKIVEIDIYPSDDQATIQAKFNYLADAGGGRAIFRKGTYHNLEITVPDHVTVIGDSTVEFINTLERTESYYTFNNGVYTRFENLRFEDNSPDHFYIPIQGNDHMVCLECTFVGYGYYGGIMGDYTTFINCLWENTNTGRITWSKTTLINCRSIGVLELIYSSASVIGGEFDILQHGVDGNESLTMIGVTINQRLKITLLRTGVRYMQFIARDCTFGTVDHNYRVYFDHEWNQNLYPFIFENCVFKPGTKCTIYYGTWRTSGGDGTNYLIMRGCVWDGNIQYYQQVEGTNVLYIAEQGNPRGA